MKREKKARHPPYLIICTIVNSIFSITTFPSVLIQIRNHRRSLQQTEQSTAASEISRTARCSPCATAQINYLSLNRITGGYHSDGLSVRSMSRCAPVGERAAPRHERWPNQTLAARFRAATSCVRNNQAFFRPLALPMSSTGKVH